MKHSCLPVAVLLLSGAMSCTDDLSPGDGGSGGNGPAAGNSEISALKVITDPSAMPASVFNLDPVNWSPSSPGKAPEAMPDLAGLPDYSTFPELPANMNDVEKKAYKISGEIEAGLHNVGQEIYMTGHWKLNGTYGDGDARIWVLPGATLEFTGNNFSVSGSGSVTIYNYGTLTCSNPSAGFGFHGDKLKIMSQSDLNQFRKLYLACHFTSYGAINVENIHFYAEGDVWVMCKIEADGNVIFDNKSVVQTGFIKARKVEFKAEPTLWLRDGGYIEADTIDIHNVDSSRIYADNGDAALLVAKKMILNNVGKDHLKKTFWNMNILCKDWIYGENIPFDHDSIGLNANTFINDDVNVKVIDGDDCAPKHVVGPEGYGPSLETITTVTNDHSHPISATSVQFADNKAYVSWHEKGDGIHGCVEVFEHADNGVSLIAYAEDPKTDYNHIMVDGNRLLTVGHNDKNAIIGEIALAGGTFAQGSVLDFTTLKGNRIPHEDNPEFYGGDGNCIIRNGDFLQVASYGGLHTLNNDLSRMEPSSGAFRTPGSAKHIASADGKIYVLNLTERIKDAESSKAELRMYADNDYTWSNPTIISSELTVSPVDGKNVICTDKDGNVYVALGHEGVRKFTGNNIVGEYKSGSPANGLAVDDKYLYVAMGKGLVIFDKNNLKTPVLTYRHTGLSGNQASCNYVAVNGDIIYLAYGRDGLDVLRMRNR